MFLSNVIRRKDILRNKIQKDVEDFLAKGMKIKKEEILIDRDVNPDKLALRPKERKETER